MHTLGRGTKLYELSPHYVRNSRKRRALLKKPPVHIPSARLANWLRDIPAMK
jgi:hypothetical protein